MRQMLVEKPVDYCFIDIGKAGAPFGEPVNEVGDAPEVALYGLHGIATLGQIVNIRICVRCQRSLGKPLFAKNLARLNTRVHGHDNSPRKDETARGKYCKLWKIAGLAGAPGALQTSPILIDVRRTFHNSNLRIAPA